MYNGWDQATKRSEVVSSKLAADVARWLIDQIDSEADWIDPERSYKLELCVSRLQAILSKKDGFDAQAERIRKVIMAHFDYDYWKSEVKPIIYEVRRMSKSIRVNQSVYDALCNYMTEKELDSLSDAVDELLYESYCKESEQEGDASEDVDEKA
jgi:hypothetical protein